MASASFSARIQDSIKKSIFVDGVQVEPLSMHATGIGQVQLLDLDFGIRFGEEIKKVLFYTFTSELSIDENIEDFQDFVNLTAQRCRPRTLLPQ
jgi:hypothetical protein